MGLKEKKNLYKVLICEDSVHLRVALRRLIQLEPDMEVIDIARNGVEAVEKSIRLKPDIITMNIHMPILDSISALKDIIKLKIAPVIMIVSTGEEGAHTTMEAIEAGAFDFISLSDGIHSIEMHSVSIIQKIRQAASFDNEPVNNIENIDSPNSLELDQEEQNRENEDPVYVVPRFGYKAVAIGLSTGGPRAIFNVLPLLPSDLNAAVFIVQHMPPSFIPTFTQRLNCKTKMKCIEAENGMKVEPGNIYVGPGGNHLTVEKQNSDSVSISLKREPAHIFMPSVDIMMISVSSIFYSHTIGVLMTGMGRDGADGMSHIQKNGGTTIAESKESAIVFGMPREAINRGAARIIRPNWDIASEIIKIVNK